MHHEAHLSIAPTILIWQVAVASGNALFINAFILHLLLEAECLGVCTLKYCMDAHLYYVF